MNQKELWAALTNAALVSPDQKDAFDAALSDVDFAATFAAENAENDTPWYLRLLVGISAWIAVPFFLGFLGLANLLDSEWTTIGIGAALVLTMLGLAHWGRERIFFVQLAFALSLTGQVLVAGGIFQLTDSMAQTALVVLAMEIALFLLYPDTLHRLLSLLAVVIATLALLSEWALEDGIHALILALAAGTLLVWRARQWFARGRWSMLFAPLGYGLPLALLASCVLVLAPDFVARFWWISAIGLALSVLVLGIWVLRELGLALTSGVALALGATLLVLLVPAWQTPGLFAALLTLGIGFWQRNGLLMGLASAFLLFFIGAYYYSLDWTLLTKSYALMGAGVVLLGLRIALGRSAEASI